jgi:hypothetical protein
MKMMKIERCNYCRFFKFKTGIKLNRFKCYNPDTRRKNKNYRIINKDIAMSGKFPLWCSLADCQEVK